MTPNPRPGESIRFLECAEIVEVAATPAQPAHPDVCGNIAEVFERYYQERSTSGRTYWFRTRCLDGHILDIEVSAAEYVQA